MCLRERESVCTLVCVREIEREGPVKCKTVMVVVPGSGSMVYVC